jgi:hypothetical protein
MTRPLAHRDHRKFVETEGWIKKGTSRGGAKTGDHYRYSLKLATGEVLQTRVSHGSGAINSADVVAHIMRDQLLVTEEDFYRCVEQGILPPRPAPSSPAPPPDALDGKLVRNLIRKVGMTQAQVAALTEEEAVAAWQEYLADGGQ